MVYGDIHYAEQSTCTSVYEIFSESCKGEPLESSLNKEIHENICSISLDFIALVT